MPRKVSRALITDEGGTRLLLAKRAEGDFAGGQWCALGGTLDPGESFEQAVAREILEEAGLALRGIEFYCRHTNNGWLTHFFTGEISGELNLDLAENSEAAYFSVEELSSIEIAFDHLQIFTDFLNSRQLTG